MPQIKDNKIIYTAEDWLGGLSPQQGLAYGLGNNFYTQRSIDPYRYYGYLSPGYSNEAVTNQSVLGARIRNGVNNGANAYLVEGGTKLHRMAISTGALLNDAGGVGFPHTISAHAGHNTVLANDCVLYNAKVGGTSALRYFYSWSDNTDWDIGTHDMHLTTPTFDDDFMSTAPATPLASPYLAGGVGYVHPMVVGGDDILYIGDRNFLHAYDGQGADDDGNFYPAVLTLPSGWIITGMAKLSDSFVIFAYYAASGSGDSFYYGESKAFFWDYLSDDPYRIKNLNDNTVIDGFEYMGTLACITSGRPDNLNQAKSNRLQIFDGNEFQIVAEFPGNPPIRGGVDILGRQIRWLCSSGASEWDIYAWRNNYDNKNTLNMIAEISGGENYLAGMLRSFSSQLLVGSTGTSAAGKLEKMNTSGFNVASLFYTGTTDIPRRIAPTKITIKFRNSNTERGFNLWIGDRYSTYQVIDSLITIDGTNIVKTTGLGHDTSGNQIPALDSIRLVGSWESGGAGDDGSMAPIIDWIEIEFNPVEFIK